MDSFRLSGVPGLGFSRKVSIFRLLIQCDMIKDRIKAIIDDPRVDEALVEAFQKAYPKLTVQGIE